MSAIDAVLVMQTCLLLAMAGIVAYRFAGKLRDRSHGRHNDNQYHLPLPG
jgi:hypothetical protein